MDLAANAVDEDAAKVIVHALSIQPCATHSKRGPRRRRRPLCKQVCYARKRELLGAAGLEGEGGCPTLGDGAGLAVAQILDNPALGHAALAFPSANLVAGSAGEDGLIMHEVAGVALLHAMVIAMRVKAEVLGGGLGSARHHASAQMATALQGRSRSRR